MNQGIDEFRKTPRSRGLFDRRLYRLCEICINCTGEESEGYEPEETCCFLALVRRGNELCEMEDVYVHAEIQLNTDQKAVSL